MLDFQIKLGCLSQLVGLKVLMKFGCNSTCYSTLEKTLGCFNPNLGQIWTNSNVGLKM